MSFGGMAATSGGAPQIDTMVNWEATKVDFTAGCSLVPQDSKGQPTTVLTNIGEARTRSMTLRTITCKILGGSETLEIPSVMCTFVHDVKELIAEKAMVQSSNIKVIQKRGSYPQAIRDTEQCPSTIWIKGIKSFQPARKEWPHPIGIIGCGYYGLKIASHYVMTGNSNFTMFDRNDRVGGYCWITGANKTSRLQTDFGMFHLWWGMDSKEYGLSPPDCTKIMGTGPDKIHDPVKAGWSMWPYKWEINKMFQHFGDQYGLPSHAHFRTNVADLKIVGKKEDEGRYYSLTVDKLDEPGNVFESNHSVIYHFPGSLTKNRIIEYPGEELFDGEIRYGMNDDTPYDKLKGSTIAILGNGAFAVENARTCLECEGIKAYIITRRKNLASPRVPCWFVHQGPMPTPGWFVLKMFEPMYRISNFGDPWDFWSVKANANRDQVSIIQNSRFGIGDVTFLMTAWGLLEWRVATVKRMSHHALHLSTGETLEPVNIVLKALGLLGDYAVDRLHNMKEMVGPYCGGDWRRCIHIDDTGMNASNFVTFSAGIKSADLAISYGYLYDYPAIFNSLKEQGYMDVLPRHKEEPDVEKPAYITDVRHAMSSGMTFDMMCPSLQPMKSWFMMYKYRMIHQSHPIERFLEVAEYEWNKYQETWKERGHEHDYVPYPYTMDMIHDWADEWSKAMKIPISAYGPQGKPPAQ